MFLISCGQLPNYSALLFLETRWKEVKSTRQYTNGSIQLKWENTRQTSRKRGTVA